MKRGQPFEPWLGRFVTLSIRRFADAGAFLSEPGAAANAPTLLLLGEDIPEGARTGDELRVFVYLDSEARPLATTRTPRLALGEVKFLRVSSREKFGAFVDWGLPKELLVPLAEQTAELKLGQRAAIGLYIDDSGRLAGTMRVREMLDTEPHGFEQDQSVDGEAWRQEPGLGWFIILERRFLALLPQHEPGQLARGEPVRVRVANILPDGKLEISLRGHAHEELDRDGARILKFLAQPNAPQFGDHSSPQQILEWFGLSKKAFKRALGRLLKQGLVKLDPRGFVRAV
jgi:predicted RNA-binding protein (virulence factor B family)